MDADSILTLFSLFFGFSYVFFMLYGRNRNPLTYRYNELLTKDKRNKHFIIALSFSVLGAFRLDSLTLETYYFSPILFILSFYFFNTIIFSLYKRPILIEVGGTSPLVNKKARFLDRFFGLLILCISLVTPLAMKYTKFDEINSHRKRIKMTATILEKQEKMRFC